MKSAAEKVAGGNNVVEIKRQSLDNEDFAYFLEKVPGTYFILGSGDAERREKYPHHYPGFNIDENVLWIGPAVFAQAVCDYLPGK